MHRRSILVVQLKAKKGSRNKLVHPMHTRRLETTFVYRCPPYPPGRDAGGDSGMASLLPANLNPGHSVSMSQAY